MPLLTLMLMLMFLFLLFLAGASHRARVVARRDDTGRSTVGRQCDFLLGREPREARQC